MSAPLRAHDIDGALAALEGAVARVTQSAREEQTASADALPAVVAAKLAALDQINAAYAALRGALAPAYGGSLHRLAETAADPALRARAGALLDAVGAAQAENLVSQTVIQGKLNHVRTVSAALQSLRRESADLPSAYGAAAGRSLGSA